jgi:hypothetical protein
MFEKVRRPWGLDDCARTRASAAMRKSRVEITNTSAADKGSSYVVQLQFAD